MSVTDTNDMTKCVFKEFRPRIRIEAIGEPKYIKVSRAKGGTVARSFARTERLKIFAHGIGVLLLRSEDENT